MLIDMKNGKIYQNRKEAKKNVGQMRYKKYVENGRFNMIDNNHPLFTPQQQIDFYKKNLF